MHKASQLLLDLCLFVIDVVVVVVVVVGVCVVVFIAVVLGLVDDPVVIVGPKKLTLKI